MLTSEQQTHKSKQSKIRYTEYYDLQSTFDRLYADSLKGKTFHNLISLMASEENIKLAYRTIKGNKGSGTPGVDKRTIKHLASMEEEKFVRLIQKQFSWYNPRPVRRVEIPKPNGKTRPLGIPTIVDRIVQQCILQVLEPICEAKFHERSNGFRPNRSTEHAIAQCCRLMQIQHLHYAVDLDIHGFFDNVHHGKLIRQMWEMGIRDKKLLCIIKQMLKAPNQSRLIQQKQSEQAYKRLMTSLSHDVKTPLASLVGYLEAVESKMVTGAEQEEYIRVAMEKAHHLKDFVTALFEWVKLDAGEQIFHFEVCDPNELSRDIMADWVPLLESHDLTYEIEIPETEYMTRVDPTAYTRILNNLLQNTLTHSDARQVSLTITETEQQAKIIVADNGKGISAADLPHIFERMYQCDHSRSAKGNGLGLSIAKELVSVHKGTITADSILEAGTTFTIILPKAL